MASFMNDNGYKNTLGFYDITSKEICLKHPFLKKKDAEEVYGWVEEAQSVGLNKLTIFIGSVDGYDAENKVDDIYHSSRGLVKQALETTKAFDAGVLVEIMLRLEKCSDLRILSLKSFSFEGQTIMFDMLMKTIRLHKKLKFLDLSGCFFTEEQLVELSEFVGNSNIAQMVWPEPVIKEEAIVEIAANLKKNIGLVVLFGAPMGLQNVAEANRKLLLGKVRYQLAMSPDEVLRIKEYKDSVRLALSYEQSSLIELQKNIESILM